MRKGVIFLLFTVYGLLFTGISAADTIYTSDKKEIKGIVVEDYRDRLVLSTSDGEMTVMKSDIQELYYDSEEDNLVKLAEQARLRNDLGRAFAYYDRAFKLNPNSKAAKDGLVFLQGFLFRQEQAKKEADVKRQEEFETYGKSLKTEESEDEKFAASVEALRKAMGITLKINDGMPEIENVQIGSPAYEAGVKIGDVLAANWGRLTGYMSLKEVVATLLEKSSFETKCTIERTVNLNVSAGSVILSSMNDLIGASFKMEFDGLTIEDVREAAAAEKAGMKKGDLIINIDGKPTRYMPLKDAENLIRNSKGKTIKLTFRREIIIWRKAEL